MPTMSVTSGPMTPGEIAWLKAQFCDLVALGRCRATPPAAHLVAHACPMAARGWHICSRLARRGVVLRRSHGQPSYYRARDDRPSQGAGRAAWLSMGGGKARAGQVRSK